MMKATKRVKIFGYDVFFVFKCRYGKSDENDLVSKYSTWNGWKISIFFNRSMMVGIKNSKNPSKWHNNLRPSYMFGVEILIFKMFFTISKGVLRMKINNKK